MHDLREKGLLVGHTPIRRLTTRDELVRLMQAACSRKEECSKRDRMNVRAGDSRRAWGNLIGPSLAGAL